MENKENKSTKLSCNTLLPNNTNPTKPANIVVKKELHDVLKEVVPVNPITTLKEVLDSLKTYICTKQLFDPLNPAKINLKNDKLGSVFGCTDFEISDVVKFVTRIVYPISNKNADDPFAHKSYTPSSSASTGNKRKNEDTNGSPPAISSTSVADGPASNSTTNVKNTTETKKMKTEFMLLFIPPSPTRRSASSDSSYSCQGYVTDLVKDTTDDSDSCADSHDIIAVEETINVEYEVRSSSSDDDLSDASGQDADISSSDELNSAIIDIIYKIESDIDYLADLSSDDDEISESDKWQCEMCGNMNLPFGRFCQKCFQMRSGWLPGKACEQRLPRRKCKSKRKRAPKPESPYSIKQVTNEESKCSQTKSDSEIDSAVPCTSLSSSQESCSTFNSITIENSNEIVNPKENICFLCCDQRANGTIIHRNSKFAHTVACYSCSKELQRRKQKCPICRRTIDRVVYSVLS